MQKKIIALAVAGLVSGAAFAQSNVTVFGIVDMGYQYSWGTASDSKTKDMSEVKAGGWDGSRIGFRGTEDLGNGLKANFEFVENFDNDTGKNGGTLMGEGAWVGLSGNNWGQVKAGYFGSFLDSDISGLDASGRHGITAANNLISTFKLANHVAYISPNFGGFTGSVGYSSNVLGNAQDVAPTATAASINVRAYEIGGTYKNGGLGLGIGYIAYKPQDLENTNTGDGYDWQAGASYDFKVAAVSLYYAATHRDQDAAFTSAFGNVDGGTANVEKTGAWALGLSLPIGAADLVTLSYADRKVDFYDGSDSDKTRGFGALYEHKLSKRTSAYAMVGAYSGDSKNVIINGNYADAVNVGVKHTF